MNIIDFPRLVRRLVAIFLASLGWTAFASPTITAQTWDQTVNAGSTVSFSVTAGGIDPLAYQRRKDGNDIGGANASVFTIANAQSIDAVGYYCQISNSYGVAWSGVANLTVAPRAALSFSSSRSVSARGELGIGTPSFPGDLFRSISP